MCQQEALEELPFLGVQEHIPSPSLGHSNREKTQLFLTWGREERWEVEDISKVTIRLKAFLAKCKNSPSPDSPVSPSPASNSEVPSVKNAHSQLPPQTYRMTGSEDGSPQSAGGWGGGVVLFIHPLPPPPGIFFH